MKALKIANEAARLMSKPKAPRGEPAHAELHHEETADHEAAEVDAGQEDEAHDHRAVHADLHALTSKLEDAHKHAKMMAEKHKKLVIDTDEDSE